MIGSLGLGLVGMGVILIWAGVKDRKVGEFFDQLRGTGAAGAPAVPQNPGDVTNTGPGGGGDFATAPIAPAAYRVGPGQAGPVLPPASITPKVPR